MDMWLLKFYGRDEMCQMALSSDVKKLKERAEKELEKKLVFSQSGDIIWVHETTEKGEMSIGAIGKVEVI